MAAAITCASGFPQGDETIEVTIYVTARQLERLNEIGKQGEPTFSAAQKIQKEIQNALRLRNIG